MRVTNEAKRTKIVALGKIQMTRPSEIKRQTAEEESTLRNGMKCSSSHTNLKADIPGIFSCSIMPRDYDIIS